MGRLDGKVAIITGAARGIGAAAAELFVSEGAKVVLTDLREDLGRALAERLGGSAHFVPHDVTKTSDWARVMAHAEDEYGRLDTLINNAGIGDGNHPLHECSESHYRRVIEINQVSVFLGMSSAFPLMRKTGGGSIINNSSAMGLKGAAGAFAYVAAKFAVTGMTKAAALDLGKYSIRVNSVHPGLTSTPMMEETQAGGQDLIQRFVSTLPISRPGQPKEIAAMMVFLASDESSFCTGAAFVVDGGMTAG